MVPGASVSAAMFEHFLEAQDRVYPQVLAELSAGRKQSHWMWFIFPQIAGLGTSDMSRRFALSGIADARAYLGHPVLGPRLRECTALVLAHTGRRTLRAILGAPDDLKFHSAMTLFHRAAPDDPPFAAALEAFFAGAEDRNTLDRL